MGAHLRTVSMFIRTELSRERIGLEKNFQCAKLTPIVHFHIPITYFPLARTMEQKYALIFFMRECAPLSPMLSSFQKCLEIGR